MLCASRTDGLWRRPIADLVSARSIGAPPLLTFVVLGPQPVGDDVRLAFELSEAGPIDIEVFGVTGRRAGESIHETRPAGRGEVHWRAARLAAGVHFAHLTASGAHALVRMVHTAGHGSHSARPAAPLLRRPPG